MAQFGIDDAIKPNRGVEAFAGHRDSRQDAILGEVRDYFAAQRAALGGADRLPVRTCLPRRSRRKPARAQTGIGPRSRSIWREVKTKIRVK